jgi:hypothetical protein
MRIETATIKNNIVYTAILIHTIIVVIAPATTIGITILLGGAQERSENALLNLIFNENLLIPFILIFSSILLFTGSIYLFLKNYKKKYIVAFEFNDTIQQVAIYYKTYYNNQIRILNVAYIHIKYRAISLPPLSNSSLRPVDMRLPEQTFDRKISFFDQEIYLGEMAIGGTYWNKEGAKVKMILQKIDEINNEPPVS